MDELYGHVKSTLQTIDTRDDETALISPDNEDALGLIFSDMYKDKLRYVALMNKWLEWDGRVWKQDNTLKVFDLIRKLCRKYFSERDALRKRLLNGGTVAAIERLVRSDIAHRATIEQWDANDWILNTPMAIADLKTGNLQSHDPEQHCTKITKVGPNGDCQTFNQFLNEITAGDQDLIDFIQRVMGYACTGSTREHALFFFYGTGANGKGTLLNTIANILNDYAVIASTDVFTESRHDRHPTELAALMGARLVVAQETDEGRKWAESKLKALTGGDPITARFMRQDFFTFLPKFTLIIAGNHKPTIQTVDEAMRRRLHLVPFTVTIPKEKRDPDLAEKLQLESAGIMSWLIDGVVSYCEQGLNPPQAVLDATEGYFEDEDIIAQWIAECCETGPDYWGKSKPLFISWKAFATAANFVPGSDRDFKSKMEAAGYWYNRTGLKGRHFMGIQQKSSYSQEKWGEKT
jgi:putative DNA primase/helicase